jgi:hypothetical protein
MNYGRFFICISILKCMMGCIGYDKLQWKLVLEGTDLFLWDRLIFML